MGLAVNEKRTPRDHTLSFLKVVLGLVATFTNDLMRMGVCKGLLGMRSKLGRQETRMILGVSAFSSMATLTWLTGKRDNPSGLPYLLPLTFSLIVGLYSLISSVRINRKVRRIRKRLEGTIEPLEGNGELQERQKQMLEKYERWEDACRWNARIAAFVILLELILGCTVLALKPLRSWDELIMLNPSRFLFYAYVMRYWKHKMFPIQ